MHRTLRRPLAAVALLGLGAFPSRASAARALSVEAWREDLRFLATELPQRHRNAFHRIPRQQFEAAVDSLDARLPELDDHAVVVGLMRLVALIGDGHTRLTLPQDPHHAFSMAHTSTPPPRVAGLEFGHYPLRLYLYADGLHVRETAPGLERALGARVLRIGRRTAAEALAAVRPLVHRDNEMGFQLLAPTLLVVPEVLFACGIATEAATVRLELEAADGTPFALQLEALAPGAVAWRRLGPTAGQPALRWRHPGTSYWFETLPEPRALYVHIDKIENRPDESYAAFAARLAETAGAQGLERLVLDLRDCAGGDGSLNRGLVLALLQLEMQARPVQIHALIGRGTFSAAVMLASDLERWTHAVFVGEPTGGSPSGYGDSRRMQLPHSGLTVRASTIYWRDWTPIEARPALEPELAVPYTAADARAGRDPVLEAALRHAPEADLAGRLRGLLERGANLPAELVYYRYKTDPRTSRIDTQASMNGLGAALCAAGRLAEAQHVYGLNLQDYPGSAAAHAGLGQVHAAAGRTQAAQESLTKCLEIDPRNAEAAALLERLRKPGG